jgi:16S rRNA (adenine1518-N6/adenine1519-N6)-dimethyltransferase
MTHAKLGQHWLIDKRTCKQIADTVALTSDETCIEIGGGKGALTKFLASMCRRLIVYEIDSNWAQHQREYGPTWRTENVGDFEFEVREQDALIIDWSRISLKLAEKEPLAIAGNLPYYLTSPLLLRLAYSGLDFKRAIFLIQKEVAEKIISSPNDSDYGRLTVSLRGFVKTQILFDIPPDAFKPRPKVMSTLIRMTRYEKPLLGGKSIRLFERLVQVAFHMRRKMLKNNIKAGFPSLDENDIADMLLKVGAKPTARAQELDVQDFVKLVDMIAEKING